MSDVEADKRYILPTYAKVPLVLERGERNCVFDVNGQRYLDLYGGHAVTVIGHSHPHWVEAISRQAERLGFFSSVAYLDGRGEAARLLVERCYSSMSQVFFCNSGAEANETALKIARKATGRAEVVAMKGGFHGRTLGALSVTEPAKYRSDFPQNISNLTRFVPFGDLEAVRALDSSRLAAVILEPVQSMAGVRIASPDYYRDLAAHCLREGIVLIFDEVQTGAGRTGRWFFGQRHDVEPDLVTCAKGIGGGFPLGAVIASEKLAATVKTGDQGCTFGGGPLACAALRATFEVLQSEGLVERADRIGQQVLSRLSDMAGRSVVRGARGLGYLIGVDTTLTAGEVASKMRDQGILVGSSDASHTFRLLPPLTVEETEWEEFFRALERL